MEKLPLENEFNNFVKFVFEKKTKISFWDMLNLDKFENDTIRMVFHNHWDYIPERQPAAETRKLLGDTPRYFKSNEDFFEAYINGESKFFEDMMTLRGDGKQRLFAGDIAFSFIPYPHGKHTHLLMAAFRVVSDDKSVVAKEDLIEYMPYIGRLVVSYEDKQGNNPVRTNPEIIKKISVAEILSIPASEAFPGYDLVRLSYKELEHKLKAPDWAKKFKAKKGVYVITDIKNGKQYVGAAYGQNGIYGRWNTYIESNGDIHEISDASQKDNDVGYPNKEFKRIIRENGGKKYIEENFQYSLLETFDKDTPEEDVFTRELYWKKVLRTREFGYNKN